MSDRAGAIEPPSIRRRIFLGKCHLIRWDDSHRRRNLDRWKLHHASGMRTALLVSGWTTTMKVTWRTTNFLYLASSSLLTSLAFLLSCFSFSFLFLFFL